VAATDFTDKKMAAIVRRALLMIVRAVEKKYDLKDHVCPHCLEDYTGLSDTVTLVEN
jgi:hypothetical protein